jgi:hypothetical protein
VAGACDRGDGGSGEASSKCGFEGKARCRPDSERVDLTQPQFSHPKDITNPLFPTATLAQVIQLGEEEGKAARFEITRLPETKTIQLNGKPVETVVRQYIAYSEGRIVEVALDFFAQADDGSVWYFGEDVYNYEDGVAADTEGTWLAGKDGPAGMIMPANPQPGDVYRPENIPGLVFEEVTVQATGETLDGPRGQVEGAILTREHLMDNSTEEKHFAPGYGEFRIRAEDELVNVALAVPIDAVSQSPPAELEALTAGAASVFGAAQSGAWDEAQASTGTMTGAWGTLQAGGVPKLLDEQMSRNLDKLAAAVTARDPATARQAAIDVSRAGLDVRLRYRPPAEVDRARLDPWARQILVDAAANDAGAVAGDVAILETIRNRARPAFDAATSETIDAYLAELRRAADAKDLRAATNAVPSLLTTLARLGSG